MSETWIGRELPPIRREGRDYFLLGHGSALYLVENVWPHRGGPLKFGYVDDTGQIVCPLHRGAFSVEGLITRPGTIRLREEARGE